MKEKLVWHDRHEPSDMQRRLYLLDIDGSMARFTPNPAASWSDVLRKFMFVKWAYMTEYVAREEV